MKTEELRKLRLNSFDKFELRRLNKITRRVDRDMRKDKQIKITFDQAYKNSELIPDYLIQELEIWLQHNDFEKTYNGKFADLYDAFDPFLEDISEEKLKPRRLELDSDQEQELLEYLKSRNLI